MLNKRHKKIVSMLEEAEEQRKNIKFFIPILGEGCKCGIERCQKNFGILKKCDVCGYNKRLEIKRMLLIEKHIVYLPEEKLRYVPNNLKHKYQDVLLMNSADIIILLPDSSGSQNEYATYLGNKEIADKMWVFVDSNFHPWYSNESGRLSQTFLEFSCDYGKLHPYINKEKLLQMIKEIISFRQFKKFQKNQIKAEQTFRNVFRGFYQFFLSNS